MSAVAPLDRLEPADFYHQLDWIRDGWLDSDEPDMTRKLQRLRRHLEHLPSRHYEEAMRLCAELGSMRLAHNPPYHAKLLELRGVISEWSRERPPLLACDECGLELRGRRNLQTHRYTVHGIEDGV